MSPSSKTRRRGRSASASATDAPTSEPPAATWHLALLVVAGLAAYAGSFSGPFIFDDIPAIAQSEAVRSLPNLAAAVSAEPESPFASRPLVSLSFALNYAVHGLNVGGYHVVNLGLHLLCGLLLFGIVRRTLRQHVASAPGRPDSLALAVALLWLVHPLNSEAVLYLTQRTESMMAVCYLLTLYAAIRACDQGADARRWQAIGVAACALGMASKESMVTAPVMVLLYDRVFVSGSFRAAWGARRTFYNGLVATLVVLALSMWSSPRTMSTGFASANSSSWIYLLNQTTMISRYVRLFFWPDALVLYYGWSLPVTLAAVWLQAVFVVALFAASVWAFMRRPSLGFLGAWFFVTLAPASSVVAIASEVGAERRMYLPVIALIILVVLAGSRALRQIAGSGAARRRSSAFSAPVVIVGIAAVVLGATTAARAREYRSSLAMAETVLARWPTGISRHMVGTELLNSGRSEEALPYLRDAAAEHQHAQFDYGTALFNVGRLDEAIEQLDRFLGAEPNSPLGPRARKALGRALARQGQTARAIGELERTVADAPGDLEARGLLADALFTEQQFERAIPLYRDFLAGNPRHSGALGNLAIALVSTGAEDEALDMFRRAAEADPANAQAQLNLALTLVRRGEIAEAAAPAAAAVRLAPDLAPARNLYGSVLAAQGRVPEAIAQFEQALRIDPGLAPAREALRVLRGGR